MSRWLDAAIAAAACEKHLPARDVGELGKWQMRQHLQQNGCSVALFLLLLFSLLLLLLPLNLWIEIKSL